MGKKLFKEPRLPEQEAFLTWLLVQIKKEKPKVLCISGDIFDTPHPSSEAQALYYGFLKEAVSENDLEIFIISGNHDSGRFLEAPLPFLKDQSIHIVGSLEGQKRNYSYHREGVTYHLFPYFRSHELYNYARENFPEELGAINHSETSSETMGLLSKLLESLFEFKEGNKNVLLAHHLFGNGELSGSELGLSLSGLESIPLVLLKENFDYVALGHLHNHQYLSRKDPVICYSGSPIAFRFSERKNKKINLVSIENNELDVQEVPIPVFRELYELKLSSENYKENLLELVKNHKEEKLESFLEVQIKSNIPLKGISDEIRAIIDQSPIKLLSLQTKITQVRDEERTKRESKDISAEELFEQFYLNKYEGEKKLPLELKNLFNDLLIEARENS
ncbi:MAG: exonuclease SbcD [Bacteriovoracaceae bacterium]